MLWYLCAVLSILMIVLGVYIFFNKKIGMTRTLLVLMSIFVATYIIYLPAAITDVGGMDGVFGNLFHTLQIMKIDAGFFDFNEIIKDGTNSILLQTIYTVIRTAVHLLLPVVSAMTAYAVLKKFLSSIKIYMANKSNKPMLWGLE